MKNYRGIIWVGLIIIVLVLVKFFFLKGTTGNQSITKKAAPPAVNALVLKPQVMNYVATVSGSLEANEWVPLQPRVNGMITGLYFKEGDFIRKGTLLVSLNDASLQARLKKEQAAVEVAQSNFDRNDRLYKISAVSEDDYNNASLALKSAEADLEFTEAEIDNMQIYAPFDGVIGVRNVSLGSYVSTATVIATLYESNPMKVEFDLPEKFAVQVNVGMSLTFTVQGNSKVYSGKVYVVNPGINPDTRTNTVKALCSNDGSLRPGSFATITIDLGTDSAALLVPTQAVIPILNGQQVYVSRRDTAFNIVVQTGVRNDTAVQIVGGLNEGDTVIISGIMFLRPKTKVILKSIR